MQSSAKARVGCSKKNKKDIMETAVKQMSLLNKFICMSPNQKVFDPNPTYNLDQFSAGQGTGKKVTQEIIYIFSSIFRIVIDNRHLT